MAAAAVTGTKVGTGYVSIEPDFSGFQEKVAKKLNQALTPAFRKAGGSAGREIAHGADGAGLRRSLRPLLRHFERFGDDAGKVIASRIGKGAKPAANDMFGLASAIQEVEKRTRRASRTSKDLEGDMFGVGRAAKRSGRELRSASSQLRDWHSRADGADDGIRRLSGRLRGLGSELRSVTRGLRTSSGGFGGFDGGMARVNRSFSFFRNIMRTLKWPLLISGLGLFVQGLSALTAGAVAATSALGPLAGALIALPAAAVMAAQAFGVLKLATAGVGDAVKAALDAEIKGGTQAVDTMRQQKDAAERVADAKRNLTSVQRQARFAQEDLTQAREDARRELEDMRLASDRSRDSEQQSVLQLRQAEADLRRTLSDPDASILDVRFAEEAIDQARNDLEQTRLDAKRARQDYRDAQKAGVKGMPQVVAAKRAQEDATQSVADAERDLQRAIDDNTAAMEQQGTAATALQEKMSQLPVAAQKFVHVLVGMKPRLDALRATAASGFFPGATQGLRGLMGNFREIRTVIDETAGALGKIASKAGRKLGSAVWGRDLTRIGKLNTRILTRMGDAGLDLADALRHILVTARPFLNWLSKGTKGLTGWMKAEAEAGRESGRLAAFFERTKEAMELLGPILKGVGGALLNIGEAARPLGNEILASLGGAAEGWREWTDSTKGQNQLRRYFTETKPAIFEMGRLLRDIGKTFFELGKQRGVAHLLHLVRTALVPALRDLIGATTGFASDFLKQFGRLRKEGVSTFEAFLRVLVDHAGRAGWAIAKALGSAFLHAGIWGKLAITGWFIHKLGGFKALATWGLEAGAALGKRFFKSAAAWIAGTETGASLLGWFQGTFSREGRFGKAAKVAGMRMGRIFGRGLALGAIAGLVLLGPAILDAIRKYIKDPVQDALKDTFGDKIGGIITDAQDVIGKNFPVGAPGGPVVREIFGGGVVIPEPKTDKAERRYREFSKSVVREGDRARTGFRKHLDLIPGIAERSGSGALRQMLPRLDRLATEGGKKGDVFASRVGGSFGSLSGITRGALENIGTNIREMLGKLGAGNPPKFNLKKLVQSLPQLPPLPGKQRGGAIATVPGNSTGDRHVLSVDGQPMARVESREGIFVGNRRMMSAVSNLNERFPRFQRGGMLREPQIMGPDGALKNVGQKAVQKVFEGAQSFLARKRDIGGVGYLSGGAGSVVERMGRILFRRGLDLEAAAGIAGNSYQESSWNPTGMEPGTDNGGLFGFTTAEKSMASLRAFAARVKKPWQDVGTQVSFMLSTLSGSLKSRLNAAATIAETTRLFMEEWEHPGIPNLPRRIEGATKAFPILKRLWRGSARRMQTGGLLKLAGGGMVDPSWDAGGETIAGSIAHLVGEFSGRYDMDITAGYDPGGGHVSPGHNATGTATDVVPRSGNWGGKFAEGLGLLAKSGFEVGYDGSIPGTEAWPNHGRGNHAHIEWVGNGTAPDARQRLRDYLGGVGGAGLAGVGGASRENIPASYRGAKTGELSFGPLPKSLEGVNREIDRRQGEVKVYRKAKSHAEKNGKPGVAQAIGRNVVGIEGRLRALRDARTRLRLQKAKKALSKKLKGTFGKFGDYDRRISLAERGYLTASQYAEQVVGLEPQQPELPASASDAQREAAEKTYVSNFTGYMEGQERPAYTRVLESVADWRNKVLRAESYGFGKGEPSVAGASTRWEKQAREARAAMARIKEFSDKVAERLRTYKRNHPGSKVLPGWLQKQVTDRDALREQLPFLQFKDKQLTGAIGKARELFFPGGENRLQPPAIPLPGSGSLEDKLTEIQGIHWPDSHELLPASALAPPRVAGRFGGIVWDVQTSIEELGLKIRQAMNSLGGGGGESEGDSERLALAEEIARQMSQRLAVSERLLKTKEQFDATYPPYAGKAHSGAIVPGPPTQERTMIVKGREGIFTEEQMAAMGGLVRGGDGASYGPPVIEELHLYPDGRAVMRYEGQEFETAVRKVVRSAPGTGRMTPGGSRRF